MPRAVAGGCSAREALAVRHDGQQIYGRAARLASLWLVPRYVYLSFGDNRLLLDLDSEAHAESCGPRSADSRGGQLLLQEALPGPQDAWAEGPGGDFITELVVPLVLRPDEASAAASEITARPNAVTRQAPSGCVPREATGCLPNFMVRVRLRTIC